MTREQCDQVRKALFGDSRLSHNAKGVWGAIAARTDGSPVTIEKLAVRSSDGRDAVRSGIDELIRYGYLIRGERDRNARGQLGAYQYLLTTTPDMT